MKCLNCNKEHEVKCFTSKKQDRAVIYYTCKKLIRILPADVIYKRVFKGDTDAR